jgi:hypothetical protein
MLIEHETAPSIAWKVFKTGVFRGGPIMGDAGLNAVPQGGIGYWSDQAEWPGAIMTFEWTGPCAGAKPLKPAVDALYDDKPHRVFVPVGTTNYLVLKEIKLKPGFTWDECVKEHAFPSGFGMLNATEWLDAIRSRTKIGKQEQIRNIECSVAQLASIPKRIRIDVYQEPF